MVPRSTGGIGVRDTRSARPPAPSRPLDDAADDDVREAPSGRLTRHATRGGVAPYARAGATATGLADPATMSPAQRVRRAVTLLVLTLLVPGSAQVAAGNRRVGRILVRIWAALVLLGVLLGVVVLLDRSAGLWLATQPRLIIAAAVLCYVGAAVLPLVLADAWRLARTPSLPRRAATGVTAFAMVAAVVAGSGLVAAGQRLWAGADFISGVFGDGQVSAARGGRFNVLLLGGDAGPDRIGTRPDSMTLASIDADTGRTILFSLPRNLENVPFEPGSPAAVAKPDGWDCGDDCLLNGIYTWGTENRHLFPDAADPGAEAMKEAVSGVTGLHVNYYALIDLRGFRDLIDALGGIRVTVNQRVPIGGGTSRVSGYIEPGTQTLDGYHALWFARSRHGASDYARMARQRCVFNAMLRQLDPATVLAKFQGIAAAGKRVVSTDVPGGELGTFLDLASKAKGERLRSVQFVPPLVDPAHPDFGVIRDKVRTTIEASHADADQPAARSTAPSGAGSGSGEGPDGGSGPSGSSSGAASGASSGASSGTGAGAGSASPSAEVSDVASVCTAA